MGWGQGGRGELCTGWESGNENSPLRAQRDPEPGSDTCQRPAPARDGEGVSAGRDKMAEKGAPAPPSPPTPADRAALEEEAHGRGQTKPSCEVPSRWPLSPSQVPLQIRWVTSVRCSAPRGHRLLTGKQGE